MQTPSSWKSGLIKRINTINNGEFEKQTDGNVASVGKWSITSLGKEFFEFVFSSLEDCQRVWSMNAWTLSQGVLKLFLWSKDVVLSTLKQTLTRVWIRIHGLPHKYWRPQILFVIASSVEILVYIDSPSNKSSFERPFKHFVRVLVDPDLTKEFSYKILVERVCFPSLWTLSMKKSLIFAPLGFRI